MATLIAPSLLAANFAHLQKDIEMINQSTADWLHLDIMDGVFVPNISFGFPVIESIKDICQKPLDVHLMIVEPDKFIADFATVGTYMLNVHYEACTHLHRTIQKIKAANMKAAVTLNPHTPICVLQDIIQDVDMVLLMSVNPGYGGQKFITNTLQKTADLKELILKKNAKALIQIDGGVNLTTGRQLVEQGADVLVAGSFVFASTNPLQTIAELKKL
ncbi:MAG: ribulose-phosphate 3-epimerase [Paludibacteraceae bacterium]|jgi:ribulose-phosphate 3-epimerase|nr:ribulose-phosphate 3-epimerase [Paludibacteraceae bacterium]NLK93340.1 ribulose-phosphate 3-epimerase [Bacteroidales bacterium]MBP6435957.1 ribulose-phosphate 3-epimerase [Paludibacteraceae bacterium]MBP8627223.1 ribulose-phosphate 3-epimerase [Paludibacteraceae bacterium]MBP9647870.1 ribulose-phosphate 3-epimerase [Paludibacteraceae bacterium]